MAMLASTAPRPSSPHSNRHSQEGEGSPPSPPSVPSPPPPTHKDPHGRRQYDVLVWQEAVVRCVALVQDGTTPYV